MKECKMTLTRNKKLFYITVNFLKVTNNLPFKKKKSHFNISHQYIQSNFSIAKELKEYFKVEQYYQMQIWEN